MMALYTLNICSCLKIKVRKEGGSKERRKEEVKLSVFMDIVLQKLSP